MILGCVSYECGLYDSVLYTGPGGWAVYRMAGVGMKVIIGDATLYHGDCMDILPTLGKVDAVVTDPPYYRVKGDFDFNYSDFTEFQELIKSCGKEWKRLLAKDSSLFIFGHAKTIAYKQVILDEYFNLENNLVWNVYDRQTKKGVENFRCFAPVTERCLFYSNEVERTGLEEIMLNVDNFKTLRGYFEKLHKFIGEGKNRIVEIVGQKSDHAFRYASTQWDLPTEGTYQEIKKAFNCGSWHGWREYESLRLEYESLRRPFTNVLKLTDVIKHSQESKITRQYNHDTIKPVGLMEKLIVTATREGAIVLDNFLGSGTTGVACANLGRKFIGIEIERKYFDVACERIEAAYAQGRLEL